MNQNSSSTNTDEGGNSFTIVIPGPPLTTNSSSNELTRFRRNLSQQLQQQFGWTRPVPAEVPVSLGVNFFYPQGMANVPGAMDRQDIAREIVMGILYVDNDQVCQKAVSMEYAPEGDVGSTHIALAVL